MSKIQFSEIDSDLAAIPWAITTGKRSAGYCSYRRIQGAKKRVKAHRIVVSRMVGRELTPEDICDHINGDKLDNRRENLRLTDRRGNGRNMHARRSASGFIGVVQDGKKWYARLQMKVNGKKIMLFRERCDTAEEAALAYNRAAARHGWLTRNVFPESS